MMLPKSYVSPRESTSPGSIFRKLYSCPVQIHKPTSTESKAEPPRREAPVAQSCYLVGCCLWWSPRVRRGQDACVRARSRWRGPVRARRCQTYRSFFLWRWPGGLDLSCPRRNNTCRGRHCSATHSGAVNIALLIICNTFT